MALFLLAVGQRHILLCDGLSSLECLPSDWQRALSGLHSVEIEADAKRASGQDGFAVFTLRLSR